MGVLQAPYGRISPAAGRRRRINASGRAHDARPLQQNSIPRADYQPQLPQRGRTGTITVCAGATIWVRATVAYWAGTSSYCTLSGDTITVRGTITVWYCAGTRC